MVDIAELADLQEIDLQLDTVNRELRRLDAQLGDPPFLVALDAEIGAQEAEQEELCSRGATGEADVARMREKIRQEEERLYGGTIADPRELRHLQEEIFALRRQLKTKEEALLALLEGEDAARAAADYLKQLRGGALEVWEEKQVVLRTQREEVLGRAQNIEAEVNAHRSELKAHDLAVYDDHRSRNPRAIARVEGGICGSCRLTLPTTVLTRARRGSEIIHCPACFCIIYLN